MFSRLYALACVVAIGVCLESTVGAYAFQGHGGMGGGHMGGAFPAGDRNPGDMGNIEGSRRTSSGVRGGLQLAPAGRWWDDKSFAKSLKLRPDQLTRMDNIFTQNRSSLLSSYVGLQQAQDRMSELSKSPNLDEAALYTQIDRVAQARAELEKANTHLQLQLRKEMDTDQLARLDKQQH